MPTSKSLSKQSQKEEGSVAIYMVFGLTIGMSIGTAFGAILGNISLGISLGMCLGVSIGISISANKREQRAQAKTHTEKRRLIGNR